MLTMDDSSDSKLNLSQWPKQKHKVKQVYNMQKAIILLDYGPIILFSYD